MSELKPPVDVAVIVVTYNRDEPLRKTLSSLLRQRPKAREIIVVDQSQHHDAETKRFLENAASAGDIKLIFQPEPNAQKARNTAIAEARSEVLLFVDDDIETDENLVGSHWLNYADDELMAVCGFYTEPGEIPLSELPADCKDPLTGWIYFPHCYTKRVACYSFATCNGSVRRDVAMRVGGFDENFTYTHLDDTDFSCRLKTLGVKTVHDPAARLIHLKEQRGGKRPGGVNDYVIADSNRWYIWCYFFWMNFRWGGAREIAKRLRGCVFRKKNLLRPWYLLLAWFHFVSGALRAARAIHAGRRLAFQTSGELKFELSAKTATTHAPNS